MNTTHKNIEKNQIKFKNVQKAFIGESIECKVKRTMETDAPVEAISPMIYTERKEGVKPEYNIRTDKWEIAQQAMDTIAQGKRQKRQDRIDKQAASSEMNVQPDKA